MRLLFWQGGFTFYAAVVIPIAGRVLQPNLHLRAHITDGATFWLNWAGVVVLALFLWDLAVTADPSRLRRRRGGSWAVLFVTLTALFFLHSWLEVLDPAEGKGPADATTFFAGSQPVHWVSTAQWVAALLYLGVTVRAWRVEDSQGQEEEVVMRGRDEPRSWAIKKVPPLASSASPSHRSRHTAEQWLG